MIAMVHIKIATVPTILLIDLNGSVCSVSFLWIGNYTEPHQIHLYSSQLFPDFSLLWLCWSLIQRPSVLWWQQAKRIKPVLCLKHHLQFLFRVHLECLHLCTAPYTSMVKCSALWVPVWCIHNGQKVKCGTLDTSQPKWTPSWLHSGRKGITKLVKMAAEEAAAIAFAPLGKQKSLQILWWATIVVKRLWWHVLWLQIVIQKKKKWSIVAIVIASKCTTALHP